MLANLWQSILLFLHRLPHGFYAKSVRNDKKPTPLIPLVLREGEITPSLREKQAKAQFL
ncbi:hypothetical protein [Helicobacter sp. T3_23-1059]